jgi:hypothetical protein
MLLAAAGRVLALLRARSGDELQRRTRLVEVRSRREQRSMNRMRSATTSTVITGSCLMALSSFPL